MHSFVLHVYIVFLSTCALPCIPFCRCLCILICMSLCLPIYLPLSLSVYALTSLPIYPSFRVSVYQTRPTMYSAYDGNPKVDLLLTFCLSVKTLIIYVELVYCCFTPEYLPTTYRPPRPHLPPASSSIQ